MDAQNVPHKLLIAFSITEKKHFTDLLLEREMAHGDLGVGRVSFKNISDAAFPGGGVIIRVEFAHLWSTVYEEKLPALSPGQEVAAEVHIYGMEPGTAWVKAVVSAEDGQTVECYKTAAGKPLSEGQFVIYVVDRQALNTVSLLHRLLAQKAAREPWL